MKKFLKGDSLYLPADNILGIDTATDTEVKVYFKGVATGGAATTSFLIIDIDGSEATAAEQLIEEINFGKKVVIDCDNNGFSSLIQGNGAYTESV